MIHVRHPTLADGHAAEVRRRERLHAEDFLHGLGQSVIRAPRAKVLHAGVNRAVAAHPVLHARRLQAERLFRLQLGHVHVRKLGVEHRDGPLVVVRRREDVAKRRGRIRINRSRPGVHAFRIARRSLLYPRVINHCRAIRVPDTQTECRVILIDRVRMPPLERRLSTVDRSLRRNGFARRLRAETANLKLVLEERREVVVQLVGRHRSVTHDQAIGYVRNRRVVQAHLLGARPKRSPVQIKRPLQNVLLGEDRVDLRVHNRVENRLRGADRPSVESLVDLRAYHAQANIEFRRHWHVRPRKGGCDIRSARITDRTAVVERALRLEVV